MYYVANESDAFLLCNVFFFKAKNYTLNSRKASILVFEPEAHAAA